jgi:hypothetical protein
MRHYHIQPNLAYVFIALLSNICRYAIPQLEYEEEWKRVYVVTTHRGHDHDDT